MTKIAVASKNPVKVNAVKEAYALLFPDVKFHIEGIAAPSGVPDQPLGDTETLQGAKNRAENLSKILQADYWIGIEGGLEEKNGEFEVFAWAFVKSRSGKVGKGRTATFFLPQAIATHIRNGKELAHASDLVFNEKNSGYKQGSVGILTGGVIDRTRYYLDMVIMAFIPFKNPELY